MKIINLLMISVLSLSLTSCGYTTKSALPNHLKSIHVQKFSNQVNFSLDNGRNLYFPLMEVNLHNAVIDRFLFDGNLRIAEAGSADLILKGSLTNYSKNALRYTDNDDVQEYRITITVSLTMIDRQTGEPRWQEPSFSGQADYFITGARATSEQSAVTKAIEDLARRIVERTIEDW